MTAAGEERQNQLQCCKAVATRNLGTFNESDTLQRKRNALTSLCVLSGFPKTSRGTRREVFFFRSDCRVAADVKYATFFSCLEWITCEPRYEENGVPLSDSPSGRKYPVEQPCHLLSEPQVEWSGGRRGRRTKKWQSLSSTVHNADRQ